MLVFVSCNGAPALWAGAGAPTQGSFNFTRCKILVSCKLLNIVAAAFAAAATMLL